MSPGYGYPAQLVDLNRDSAPGYDTFAPNGGFNFSNPLFSMLANLMVGGNIMAPMGGTSQPIPTYLEAAQRSQAISKLQSEGRFNGRRADGSLPSAYEPFGKIAEDPIGQWGLGMLGIGGGNVQSATEAATSYFSKRLLGPGRHDPAQEVEAGHGMVRDMQEALTNPYTKNFDYKRSHGFDLPETINNLRAYDRLGFGGVDKALRDREKDPESFKKLLDNSNELMQQQKETFGPGMSDKQMGNLLDKAMGGIAGVDPAKASQFLDKVQSTARALDMSGRAFAEYVAMQQDAYKQVGVGGALAADMITNAALSGRSSARAAKDRGDTSMANENVAVNAQNALNIKYAGSDHFKVAVAIGSRLSGMTEEQKARTQVGTDGETVSSLERQLKAAVRSGDNDAAERIRNQLMPALGGAAQIQQAAQFMTSREISAAHGAGHVGADSSPLDAFKEETLIDQISGNASGDEARAGLAAAGISLNDVLKGKGAAGYSNLATITANITAADKGKKLTKEQTQDIASKILAASVIEQGIRVKALVADGATEEHALQEVQKPLENQSPEARKRMAAEAEEIERMNIEAIVTRQSSGGLNKMFSGDNIAQKAPAVAAKIKEIADKAKGDLSKVNWDDIGKVAKDAGLEIAGSKDIAWLNKLLGDKSKMDEYANVGRAAYKQVIDANGTESDAILAQRAAIAKKADAEGLSGLTVKDQQEMADAIKAEAEKAASAAPISGDGKESAPGPATLNDSQFGGLINAINAIVIALGGEPLEVAQAPTKANPI